MAIDDTDHLLHSGDVVIDLGASPGGWSQVAARRLQGGGRVIAVDLLAMEPLRGVTFLQGDFREPDVIDRLETILAGKKVGLVLSDMSPNILGYRGLRSGAGNAFGGTRSGVCLQVAETTRGLFWSKFFRGMVSTIFSRPCEKHSRALPRTSRMRRVTAVQKSTCWARH